MARTTVTVSNASPSDKNYTWRIPKFCSLKVGAKRSSKPVEIFPGCCEISFKLIVNKVEHVAGRVSFTIATHYAPRFGKAEKFMDHLKEVHKVTSLVHRQYLLNFQEKKQTLVETYQFSHHYEAEWSSTSEQKYPKYGGQFILRYSAVRQGPALKSTAQPRDSFLEAKRLLETGDLSDFTIQARGESFKVHKTLLAMGSPIFRAMFCNSVGESKHNLLKLDHINPHVVKKFIDYIYTNNVYFGQEDRFETAKKLLNLANQYRVTNLEFLCEKEILSNISRDTLAIVLKMADTYSSNTLRDGAYAFIKTNKTLLADPNLLGKLLPKATQAEKDLFAWMAKC